MDDQQLASQTVVSGMFVGDALSFSDITLKLAATGLPEFGCIRVSNANDLLFMNVDRAASVRIIVFDEAMVEHLLRILPQLRSRFPQANLAFAFRLHDNACRLLQTLRDDADLGQIGFLPMNLHMDCWLSVLQLLINGVNYVPAELVCPDKAEQKPEMETAKGTAFSAVADSGRAAPRNRTSGDQVHLTAREWQVLAGAAAGKQNKIIADELQLSQHTVKLHLHHVIAKLRVHNRTEAAIWYLQR